MYIDRGTTQKVYMPKEINCARRKTKTGKHFGCITNISTKHELRDLCVRNYFKVTRYSALITNVLYTFQRARNPLIVPIHDSLHLTVLLSRHTWPRYKFLLYSYDSTLRYSGAIIYNYRESASAF